MHTPTQIFNFSKWDIDLPVYIHKIGRATYWNFKNGLIDQAVKHAQREIFNSNDFFYSLWLISSEEDLAYVAANLNSTRDSLTEEIYFIWIYKCELDDLGLSPLKVSEGKCLYVRKLHFNVFIKPDNAKSLCHRLMTGRREYAKCTKGQMKQVQKMLEQQGCKVCDNCPEMCKCEE